MQITAVRQLTSKLAAPGLSSSVTGSTATLSWTAPTPTGQSVIAGYRLYKGTTVGSQTSLVGTTTGTSLPDTMSATTFYRVEAFDQFDTGTTSSPVSCSPVTAGAIRWAPGHYARQQSGYHFATADADTIINDLNTIPAPFRGVKINAYYGYFDRGTSSANYSQGINDLGRVLDAALAVGRFICLQWNEQNFTNAAFPNSPTYPGWWNSSWCRVGTVPKIYADFTQAGCFNAISAQIQAYGAAFKNHAALAWFSPFDDSSISGTGFPGLSYYNQRVALGQVARDAFPNTMVKLMWSYTNQATAGFQTLIQNTYDLGGALIGCPDPPLIGPAQADITQDVTSYRIYRGSSAPNGLGTFDFRPKYRLASEVQDIGLSVSQNRLSTPSNIWVYQTTNAQLNPSFMSWQQENNGNAQTSWAATKTYVASIPGTNHGINVSPPNDGRTYQAL